MKQDQLPERSMYLAAVAEQSNNIIVAKNLKLQVVAANHAFVKITGYQTLDEIVGKTDAEIFGISPDEEPVKSYIADELAAQKMKQGEFILKEEPVKTAEGLVKYYITKKYPIFDQKGTLIGTGNISTDSSAAKEAREALQESNDLFELFFHNTTEGFFFMMLDEPIAWNDSSDKEALLDYVFEHQRITRVNEAMLDQYGAKEEDFLGATPASLFSHDMQHGREVWRELFDEGRLTVDTREKNFAGEDIHINGGYTCLYDKEGRILGHFGLQREVTAERNARNALKESEEKYRFLANNILDLLAAHDPDGTYTYVSPSVTEMLGYHPDELIGKNPYTFFHPEDCKKVREGSHNQALEGIETKAIEYRFRHKNDYYIWLSTRTRVVISETGQVEQLITISRDISEIRKAQTSLQQFRFALDNSSDSVFLIDADTLMFLDVNKVACNELGYTKDELLQMKASDIKPFLPFAQLKNEVLSISEKGAARILETVHQKKSGEQFPVEVRLRAFSLDGKKLAIAIARDIANRKIIEEKLMAAKEAAIAADRAKSKFLANMSHEVHTPMNAILGFAQLLEREKDLSETQKSYARNILQGTNSLLELLKDIFEIYRIDSGREKVILTSFNPVGLLDELETRFADEIKNAGPEFFTEFDNSLPQAIVTDEQKLRTIITNLLENAIKFTRSGKIVIRMILENDGETDNSARLIVEVEDTGCGIKPQDIKTLFDKFQQSGEGLRAGSTGLGLSICKSLLELMGGEISVESTLGKGSCFRFSLPVAIGKETDLTSISEPQTTEERPKDNRTCRVLIADSAPINRMLLKGLLHPLGCQIAEAENMSEIFARIDDFAPSIILAATNMPDIRDTEVFSQIKGAKNGKSIPLVAITATLGCQKAMLDAGADDFLRKPVKANDLYGLIEKFCQYKLMDSEEDSQFSHRARLTPSSSLPEALQKSLKEGVENGDLIMIKDVIEKILLHDRKTGEALKKLAVQYAYDEILSWLAEGE